MECFGIMKGYINKILSFSLLLLTATQVQAQAQEDRNVRYQEERRVITRWNSKWNPKTFWGRGFTGGISGSLSRDVRNNRRYRRGRNRNNALQLAPTVVVMKATTDRTTKTEEMVNEQFIHKTKELADKTLNLSYNEQAFGGYGRKFRKLEADFYESFYSRVECYELEECRKWRDKFERESLLEFEKMIEEIKLIKDSFEQDSVKSEFYFDKHEEMAEFVTKYRITKHNKKATYKFYDLLENR